MDSPEDESCAANRSRRRFATLTNDRTDRKTDSDVETPTL
jgi:hypothetical protein